MMVQIEEKGRTRRNPVAIVFDTSTNINQSLEQPDLSSSILLNKNQSLVVSQFAPEAYDAVWTIGLGLQQLQEKWNYSLENFNYMDDYFSYLLNDEIEKLQFTGISVRKKEKQLQTINFFNLFTN